MIKTAVEQVIVEMKSHPFTLLTVLGLVCFAVWGFATYAQASDVDQRVTALEDKVADNGRKIDGVSKLLIAESIRSLQRQICETSNDGVKSQLQVTMDTLQSDYESVNGGKKYEVTRCANGA